MDTGFSTQQITQMLGLSPTRVRAYVKAGLLCPQRGHDGELRFSFQDLLLLRTAEGLVTDRLPPRRVRAALRKLRRRLPSERPLTGMNLGTDGQHVVIRDGGTAWRADSGQGLLSFSAAQPTGSGAVAAARGSESDGAGVSPLRPRRAPVGARAGSSGDGGRAPEDHVGGATKATAEDVMALIAQGEEPLLGRGGVDVEPTPEQSYQLACDLEDEAPEAARVAYLNVLKADPHHADAHVNLGRLMHVSGDLEFAEEHYRAALEVRPNDATAYFNLGVVLEDRGRPEAAVENYEAALRVDPKHADAHFNAARLHDLAGRYEAALRHLRAYRDLTTR